MAFFKPGKVFELQKWTADETLNGKILGIIDKKTSKGAYPCYIFETQQIIKATAAQLTYPELEANNKKKLSELLQTVIEQKKSYQVNLAEQAVAEERRKLLEKKEAEQQAKIQAVIPNVVFDINDTSKNTQNTPNRPTTPNEGKTDNTPQIVIQQPPKNLYKNDSNDTLLIEKREATVPKGYALVPVSTLDEVVKIKNQESKLQQKEIELISKENELSLAQKQNAMEQKKKEIEYETKQREIEMHGKNLGDIEHNMKKREDYNRKYEEEIMRKQKNTRKEQDAIYEEREKNMRRDDKKKKKYREDDYDERDRKRRKKKRKKKKKDEGCTTGKCCKCLLKLSSICFIIAFVAGIMGLYFYFVGGSDERIFAFLFWAGAILALVFGVLFYCKG